MNFRDLEYFLAITEEMNISKAAEKLYVSQQSLSARIAKLEKTYHVLFFERTPHLQLTKAGKCLEKHAKRLLSQKKLLDAELEHIATSKNQSLTIGVQTDRGALVNKNWTQN